MDNPINRRLITATFRAKPRDVILIKCYAPTQDKSEQEVEEFYVQLSGVMRSIPKKHIVVLIGDFNARVGSNAEESLMLGRYGTGERDEAGQRLVDFCNDNNLTLTNTLFNRHPRHLYTWK